MGAVHSYGTIDYTYDEFGNRLTETSGGTTKTYNHLVDKDYVQDHLGSTQLHLDEHRVEASRGPFPH